MPTELPVPRLVMSMSERRVTGFLGRKCKHARMVKHFERKAFCASCSCVQIKAVDVA